VIMGMGLADLLGFWLNCSNGRRKKFCRHQIFSRRWLFWLLILTFLKIVFLKSSLFKIA
jgi:hypothetical protein